MVIRYNTKDETAQVEIASSSVNADRLMQETIPDTSSLRALGKNPFLDLSHVSNHVKHEDALASPDLVKESEAMRKWKEMKQNGFLSDPHGGMPSRDQEPVKKKRVKRSNVFNVPGDTPLPTSPEYIQMSSPQNGQGSTVRSSLPSTPTPAALHGEESSFKRNKRIQVEKREQGDMFKSAPPSGLLSGLNIGVIRRIRKPTEVCASLKAMMQPQKIDAENGNKDVMAKVENVSYSQADSVRFLSAVTTSSDVASRLYGANFSGENTPPLYRISEWRGKSFRMVL